MKKFKSVFIDEIEDLSKNYDDDHQWMVFEDASWNGLNVSTKEVPSSKNSSLYFTEKVVKIKKGEPTFLSDQAKNVIENRFPELSFRNMK